MGMSRIEITVTGNHGCDRAAKEGEPLGALCTAPNCVDCRAREFVAKLKAGGNNFCYPPIGPMDDGKTYEHGAIITHWPGSKGEVVDDLVAGTRKKGHF